MAKPLDSWHEELKCHIEKRDYSAYKDRRSVTSALTAEIAGWATGQGFDVQTEVSAEWMCDSENRRGRVDMVLTSPRRGKRVAIEIDRTNKSKSSRKLQRCEHQGWDALWVRWDRNAELIDRLGFKGPMLVLDLNLGATIPGGTINEQVLALEAHRPTAYDRKVASDIEALSRNSDPAREHRTVSLDELKKPLGMKKARERKPTRLPHKDLSHRNFGGENLSGAILTGSIFVGSNLTGANLIGANLIGANLIGANLTGANLTGANLTGAFMSGVTLNDADLTDANLMGANLRNASRRNTKLTGARMPDGTIHE